MRTLRTAAVLLLLPLLTGAEQRCSKPDDRAVAPERVELARIDPELRKRCPPLTVGRIPEGDQELRVVFPLVRNDLENYRVCRYKDGALIAALEAIEAGQGAQP